MFVSSNLLERKAYKVKWHKLVQFKKNISRHAFITWLAIKGTLNTKDKLWRLGIKIDAWSCFCKKAMESVDHLFFACNKTNRMRKEIVGMSSMEYDLRPWNDYIKFLEQHWNSNDLKYRLGRLSLGATTYSICGKEIRESFLMRAKEWRPLQNL